MSLLTTQGLSLSHGDFDVFKGISFTIPQDARIGLVGPNGIGKTTLLQILAGVVKPDTGSVHLASGRRLGYLRQEAVEAFAARDHSVYAEMLTVFAPLLAHSEALRQMEARMAAGDHGDEIVTEYGHTLEAFELGGGYEYEARIERVLEGLGFQKSQWEMLIPHLSGGQKTRALLARLLLEAPDLLILDEPTNHLDVEAIEWLESTLLAWEGALLVVSHDRYFLDRVADRIWEMSRIGVEIFRGNYTAYLGQRQERWTRREQTFLAEKERLEKEVELIKRYIAWRKFDEARGKLKRLSRELAAIAELGLEGVQGKSWSETGLGGISALTPDEAMQRIRAIPRPISRPPEISMRLKSVVRSGAIVLRATDVEAGYPGNPLFTADPIELHRGDCAALIGPNGAGKTTFLRTILGSLAPLGGSVALGTNLHVGYFAQAHEALDPDLTVLDTLLSRNLLPAEARNHLAQYLFRGDDVFKLVRALSGGERGRLALSLLALEGANFLLLDEPTNHLDIPAQETLQEGLERFEGTLLLVSHDRYLVSRLATQIWEIREGRLHVFKGTYQEMLAVREREEAARKLTTQGKRAAPSTVSVQGKGAGSGPVQAEATAPSPAQAQGAASALGRVKGGSAPQVAGGGDDRAASNGKGKDKSTAPASGSSAREERKRVQMLASLEKQIAEAEAQLADWEQRLQVESEAQRHEEVREISERYSSTQAHLEGLMESWVTLAG